MVKYCPSCGTEASEGSKFCLSCGASLTSGAAAGSSTFENQVAQTQQTGATAPGTPPPAYGQPQAYAPMQPPKKFNMKLIVGIIIAVVAIVVVLLVVFLFLGGGLGGGPLSGEWKMTSGSMTMYNKLNGDGSWEMATEVLGEKTPYVRVGTWKEEGGQLCFTIPDYIEDMDIDAGSQCYGYTLSEDGRTLTLTVEGQTVSTWTKV